jgi:hypothetical protein
MQGLSWQMRRAETGAYLDVREDFEHRLICQMRPQMATAVAFQQPAIAHTADSGTPDLILLRQQSQAGWQSGYAAACKAVDAGSIPTPASKPSYRAF